MQLADRRIRDDTPDRRQASAVRSFEQARHALHAPLDSPRLGELGRQPNLMVCHGDHGADRCCQQRRNDENESPGER